MSAGTANGSARSPAGGIVILVVAEDFGSLLGPLAWLTEAGHDVRACLGPLAADRVCRMFDREGSAWSWHPAISCSQRAVPPVLPDPASTAPARARGQASP